MLLHLPAELVVKVLECVDPATLRACKSTCVSLHARIQSTSFLAYTSLLHSNALALTHHTSSHDSRTSLYRLHAYLAKWRSLNFKQVCEVRAGPGWQMHGGRVLSRRLADSVAFFVLPSRTKCIQAAAWVIDDVPAYALLSIDVRQDLLLVIERDDNGWFARPLSLSTGTRHPSAAFPSSTYRVFPYSLPSGDVANIGGIQVCGSTVGMLCGSRPKNMQLVLYNWTTSSLVSSLFVSGITSFAFVTPMKVLVAARERPNGARASTYRQNPVLLVYDLRNPDSEPTRYELPTFVNGGFVAGLSLSADSTAASGSFDKPMSSSNGSNTDRVHGQGVFVPSCDPYSRTFALWILQEPDVVLSPNTWTTQTLVISARAFAPRHELISPGETVPWTKWGPRHSRLFAHPERTSVVDGRIVRLCDGEIEVLDFAPARVRAAATRRHARSKTAGASRIVVQDGTAWPHTDDAETRLPYVSTKIRMDVRAEAVHICEDGLIFEMRVRSVWGTKDAEGPWAEGDRRLVICTS